MASRVTRGSRPFIALATVSVGLAACSSPPTAPSSRSAGDTTPQVAASASATFLRPGGVQATAADTIKVTQGTLAFQSRVPGSVSLRGSHGFRLDGSIISGLEPSESCSAFNPCQPGATVPVALVWVGTDIPGTVRLQGEEFPVGSLDTASVYIELNASFVAPAHLTDRASVTVPFAASGLLSRATRPALHLTGRGDVTFTLAWQPFISGWAITHTSFDFGNGGGPD